MFLVLGLLVQEAAQVLPAILKISVKLKEEEPLGWVQTVSLRL